MPETMRQRRGFYAGLVATWLMLPLLVGGVALHAKMGEGLDYFTPWTYAKTQATVLVHYLRLCFVPSPLVIDYDDWPRATGIWPEGVFITGLVVATIWGVCQRRWWGFLGAWFLLILAPTSSFIPLATEVAAERRMYLPLIAVIVPVVLVLRNSRIAIAVLALSLGVLTFQRNADYRTAEKIWRVTVDQRPNNVRALVNLATFVLPVEAIELYERALQLAPNSAEAHYNLGIILAGQKRMPDALPHFQRAAELSPQSSLAQYQLGVALASVGKWPGAEAAMRHALELEPHSHKAQQLLAAILKREAQN